MKTFKALRLGFMSSFVLVSSILVPSVAQDDCSTSPLIVQHKHRTTSTYQTSATRTICQLPEFYEGITSVPTNKYGSRTDKKTTATGYFHTKLIDGRWWIVDPDGYLNLNRGINAVGLGVGTTSKNALTSKFGGSSTTWMTETMKMLNDYGFNCAGAWSTTSTIVSNPRQATNPLPYTIIFNWLSGYGSGHKGYPNDYIFVFEDSFAIYCNTKAQALANNKNDKNLFGYFSDNELPFKTETLNNFIRYGKTSPTDPGYLAATKWMTDNNYTLADTLNTDVQERFLGFVAQKYYSIVYNAIKKYDPNHMVLGSRVNSPSTRDNKYFMEAMGPYVDLCSINYYNVWTPVVPSFETWSTNLGKPLMVTEFYTKGEDSGYTNTTGAGWIVKTQLDRGYEYQNYTLALLESKYCVGWNWFKYMDNDSTVPGVDPSNIDANKGIVKIDYEPYLPLVNKMKELNTRVYNLIDYFDARPAPTTIYPEADAYFKGNVNYGTDTKIIIKNALPGLDYHREGFLRFNLSSVAISSGIKEANLKLFIVTQGSTGVTYQCNYVPDNSWAEGAITYASQPAATAQIYQWQFNSDVTMDVRKWFTTALSGDKKLSVKISAVNGGGSPQEYASRENATKSLRPQIEIIPNAADTACYLTDLMIYNKRVLIFQPYVFSYTMVVPDTTKATPSIAYTLPHAGMEVVVTHPVNISSTRQNDRVALIKVTSANGTKTRTYAITYNKSNLTTNYSQPASEFSIFPNPVACKGIITLKLPNRSEGNHWITIRDLQGKNLFTQLLTEPVSSFVLPSFLSPGFYFVSMGNQNGTYIQKLQIN